MSDFYNKYPYTDFHELNLDWVIERVKKLTEDWADTLEEWNSTEEQWQELYDYVHDYFDNLNVQEEINNKIDAMILDGTFQQIATPIIQAKVAADLPGVVSDQIGGTVASQIGATVASQIGAAVASQIDDAVVLPVNTWLSQHITQPTTPAIDTSLTVGGAAADAAVAGNMIRDTEHLLSTELTPLFKKAFTKIYTDDVMYYRKRYRPDVEEIDNANNRCLGRFINLPWGSLITYDYTKYFMSYYIVDKQLGLIYSLDHWYENGSNNICLGQIKQDHLINYDVLILFKKTDNSDFDETDFTDLLQSINVYAFNDNYITYLKNNNVKYCDLPYKTLLKYGTYLNNSDPDNVSFGNNSARCCGLYWFIPNNSKVTYSTSYRFTYFILDEQSKKQLYAPNTWYSTGETVIDASAAVNKNYSVILQFKKADDTDFTWADYSALISSLNIEMILIDDSTVFDEVDLFMFMGQSNMAGRGISDTAHPETAPTIITGAGYEYRAISDPTHLYPIAEPFGVNENNPSGINDGNMKTGSMVTAFANAYYTATGRTVIGVSASKGGSTIAQWEPGAASGYMTDALQRLSDCVSYLTAQGYNIKHKFVLWCQGESDMDAGTSKISYLNSLQNVINALKTAGIEKFMMVRIGNCNEPGRYNDYKPMIEWQTELCQTNPDVVLADADFAGMYDRGLMKDYYHYYQQGYNEVGRYAGTNCAIYADYAKEPTMYDTENDDLYYSHKN